MDITTGNYNGRRVIYVSGKDNRSAWIMTGQDGLIDGETAMGGDEELLDKTISLMQQEREIRARENLAKKVTR